MSLLGDVRLPGVDGALARYRIMAYAVGTGLIILVVFSLLQTVAAVKPEVAVIGVIHGVLYIVYLLAALDLARRARFKLWQMAAMVGAGFLPFLAFIIERRITKMARAKTLRSWRVSSDGAVSPTGSG